MNIPLTVHGVLTSSSVESQIVILKDPQNIDTLPIWVGATEGHAIRLALDGVFPKRPQSHDLLHEMLTRFGVQMEKVVITEIRENVYFAALHLLCGSGPLSEREEKVIDARPSDAIALALRMGVPIYASEEVLGAQDSDHLKTWIEKLKPSDFGSD
jgi:bifunctional DNase/RNase